MIDRGDGHAAICFVLANPRLEPCGTASSTEPRWSPERRLGYGAGLRAAVHSIRRRHRTPPPILLLTPADDPPTLADVDDVIPIDTRPYPSFASAWSFYGAEVFYKLEVYRLTGYDRVIYLDCDVIVLGDISPLWAPDRYRESDIYAVRETTDMGLRARPTGMLNTAVMILNAPIRGDAIHHRLLEIARRKSSPGDQGVLQQYLQESPDIRAGELEAAYNVPVLAKRFGRWDRLGDDIRILHFVNHLKPWSPLHHRDPLFDADLKRLWDAEYAFRRGIAGR